MRLYSPLFSGEVSDTTPVVCEMNRIYTPRNVWVVPSSATVSVEYSTDGGNSYSDWPAGDVTSSTSDTLIYPVSKIRFTLVSGTSFTFGIE